MPYEYWYHTNSRNTFQAKKRKGKSTHSLLALYKMTTEKISPCNGVAGSNDKMNPKTDGKENSPAQKSRNRLPSPPSSPPSSPSPPSLRNNSFFLGCLIYFVYSMSIAVDGQFLSLYYKSKGFDGTTLGFLYSLTPLTTFLTVPIWSMLTATGDGKNSGDGNGKSNSNSNKKATGRSFKILYLSILLATASQICLAILDKPKYMMIVIVIAGIFQSPAKPMLDGIIMDNLSDRSEFGKVRFFCILGTGFGTNLGGRLLSLVSSTRDDPNEDTSDENNFNLLFLARVLLTIPPIILIRQLQVVGSSRIENDDAVSSNHIKRETVSDKGDQQKPSPKKEDSIPIHSIARSVAHYCCRDTAHLLFFACIYVAGSSGGVSDAFSCECRQ